MPLLQQRMTSGALQGYVPVPDSASAPQAMHQPPVVAPAAGPVVRGFMRSPIPPIFSSNPDSRIQFYKPGVAQYRAYTVSVKK